MGRSPERLVLHPEQQQAVARMLAEPTRAALLAGQTATGKTVLTVELALGLNAEVVLVIAPPNTLKQWEERFRGQGWEHPILRIDRQRLANAELLRKREPGVYLVSRTWFALAGSSKEDHRERLVNWGRMRPDLCVYDEGHAVSNRRSVGFSALKNLDAGYKVIASATPQGNRFAGIWSLCRWLWPRTENPLTGKLYVDNSFHRWVAEWCRTEYNPFSGYTQPTGERVEGAFVASLPCYIRLERESLPVDLRKVYVDLTPYQRELYDQMEEDGLVWLDNNPMSTVFPMVKRMRMRQITLGVPTLVDTGEVDEYDRTVWDVTFEPGCESSKIDALEKIIRLHPDEPMLILGDSSKFAAEVARRIGGALWTGGTSAKQREQIKSEFGKSVKYIVATTAAVAEGLDGLQHVCHIDVWLSLPVGNDVLKTQAEGRLDRPGQKADKLIRYHILARDTDDDGHFEALLEQNKTNLASLRVKGAGK